MSVEQTDEDIMEVSLNDTSLYLVDLSDANFITIVDDDIMVVEITDGVCC